MPEDPIQTPPGTDAVPPVATTPEQPQTPPTVPSVDYEKKFADSTRENQILNARIAELEKAGKELTTEPTDSELRTAFPSWELMSDTEKELARRTIAAERTAGTAVRSLDEIKADRSWNTSIELALTSNSALQGKEQVFRQYASRPQYRNVPMDVLVPAFLQSQGPAPAAPAPTPRPGLEPGNGGPRTPEAPKTFSAEELSALRQSDPKAWEKYIKTHDINIEV